jgi:hypothetical protein
MESVAEFNEIPWGVVERTLSPPRMARYLVDAQGDEHLAIALCEWNNELGAAHWQLISLVEVALRNSIDLKTCERAE